jgi:hypothetical protein
MIQRIAQRQGIRIYRYANSGNHLHVVLRAKSRVAYQRFIRTVTGLIARLTLGVERGRGSGIKFWDARPFTRILEWGRDYQTAVAYVSQNTLEALGFVPYAPRKKKPG